MALHKLRRKDAPQAAVRRHFVVVLPLCPNRRARLRQALEPVLVQALVAELAVEALDVAVLHRSSLLDQDIPHAMGLRLGDEGAAGELRPLVGTHRGRVAASI